MSDADVVAGFTCLDRYCSQILQKSLDNLEDLTTPNLVARLKKGPCPRDSDYCMELDRRFRPMLVNIWRTLGTRGEEYRDFVQDFWLRFFRFLPVLRDPEASPAVFRQIAKSAAADMLRKKRSRDLSASSALSRVTVLASIDNQLTDGVVIAASMHRLTPLEQDLVRLRLFDHCSFEEIASLLNMKPEAARSAFRRARSTLRMIIRRAMSEHKQSRPSH